MRATLVAKRYETAAPEVQAQIDRLLDQHEGDQIWADELGAAYSRSGVAQLLDISHQAVAKRSLLSLKQRNGSLAYPVLQFDGDRVVRGVEDVVRLLAPVVASAWTVASWLTSPQSYLGGARPIDRLRAGDVDEVLAGARRFARTASR